MTSEMTDFTDTTGTLAHQAKCSQRTIIEYCDAGLLEFVTLSNGMRLLRRGQKARVRKLLAQRLANRGRRPDSAGTKTLGAATR
jgi:single-stranded DNA-binding protein